MNQSQMNKSHTLCQKFVNIFNKNCFNLNKISLARGFLYGLAILWIMFFHSELDLSGLPILKFFKEHGNCGVDIFFFLSSISLYFSFTKNSNIKHFYANRFLRVLPLFLALYGTAFIFLNIFFGNFTNFLLEITTVDFFFRGTGAVPWFLPAIIVLYLAYPFIYKMFFNKYKGKKFCVTFFLLSLFAIYMILNQFCPELTIFVARWPVIILGIACGKLVYEKKALKTWHLIVAGGGF